MPPRISNSNLGLGVGAGAGADDGVGAGAGDFDTGEVGAGTGAGVGAAQPPIRIATTDPIINKQTRILFIDLNSFLCILRGYKLLSITSSFFTSLATETPLALKTDHI